MAAKFLKPAVSFTQISISPSTGVYQVCLCACWERCQICKKTHTHTRTYMQENRIWLMCTVNAHCLTTNIYPKYKCTEPKTKKPKKGKVKWKLKWNEMKSNGKKKDFRKKFQNNAAVNGRNTMLAVCLFTRCLYLFVQCVFSSSQMTAAIKISIAIQWEMGAHVDKKCAARSNCWLALAPEYTRATRN